MRITFALIGITLGVIVLLGGALWLVRGEVKFIAGEGDVQGIGETLTGRRAPAVDLPSLEGGYVSFDDYLDTPLVVLFWNTASAEGRDQLTIVDSWLESHAVERSLLQVFAINSLEDESLVKSFIRRGGYLLPVLLDTRGRATEAYEVRSMPTFFFIGRDGVVHEVVRGVLSEAELGDKLQRILR